MNCPLRISGHISLRILCTIVAWSYVITFSTLCGWCVWLVRVVGACGWCVWLVRVVGACGWCVWLVSDP